MKVKQKRVIIFLMLLILSVIYSLPLFLIEGINHFENQDTYFHLSRIIGLSNVLSSPVNFNNFAHHGTMINSFYPWLTVYPMYLIFKLTNSLVLSYKIFYFILTFCTMIISFFSVYKIKKSNTVAFLFSVVYTFATYRSIDIFQRASLGEAVALTFLPLVLSGCYMIFFQDYQKWYYLTIGMTLTLYTHLLSVAMASSIILFVLFISLIFWDNRIIRLKKLLYATLWTIFLSLGFLIPFFQQSRAYSLKVPDGNILHGVKVSDFLINSLNNDSYTYTLGFFLLVFGLVVFINIIKEEKNSIDKGIFFLGFLVVIATTSLFPWQLFSNTPVNKLQFVWRLTTYSTLFISYGISFYISSLMKNKYHIIVIVVFINLLLHTSSITNLFSQHPSSKIVSESIIENAENYVHNDYANKESINHSEFMNNYQFYLNNEKIHPKISNTDSILKISVNSKFNNAKLITPIYRYLGQQIRINGKPADGKLSRLGTTEVDLGKGTSVVSITYNYSFLAKLSALISFVSLIFFVFLIRLNLTRKER